MDSNQRNEFPPRSLNIAAYNIRGLKSKVEKSDFMNYLRTFDVFILIETHSLPNAEDAKNFRDQQPDFECLHWKDAERVFRYGRGIGGCIIGIRKSLLDMGVSHSVVNGLDGLKVLQLRVRNKKLHIVPLYIRSADWNKEFEPVTKTFRNTESPMENAIVMGDVNIRLGELKQEVEQFTCVANTNGRRSLDKERNEKGKKFFDFCNAQNLKILNGLTRGDAAGSFTCISGMGKSTNDICAVSLTLMSSVVDFKVDSVNHGSDHFPICLQLNLQVLTELSVPRVLSIQQNSLSLAWLDVTYESALDTDVSVAEVMRVLKRVPFPGFSKNPLKNFVEDVTLQCNDVFNTFNTNGATHSQIVSQSNITEILIYIIERRLLMWCEQNNILSDCQTRFSKKTPKIDTVYNLNAIVNLQMTDKGKKVYAFFVQFKSISSTAFIEKLWNKLNNLGVSSKIVNFLKYLYKQSFHREQLLNYFQNEKRTLSDLMFSLYLNDLPEKLEGGLSIDDRQINMLMYADNIVLLSDTVSGLQDMIIRMEKYCCSWCLNVDLSLSEVMIFRRGGRISEVEKCFFTGKEIKTTSQTIYLGFVLTSTFSYTNQVQAMIEDAKSRLEDFRNDSLSEWTKLMIQYMAPLWGSYQKTYNEAIWKLQKSYLKVNSNNSTDLNSLALDLHLRYIGQIYFSHAENSIVRFLTLKIVEKNIMWAENLNAMCIKHQLQWKEQISKSELWTEFCSALISLEKSKS